MLVALPRRARAHARDHVPARRRTARTGRLALATGAVALLLTACLTEEEASVGQRLAEVRAQHGLPALQLHEELQVKAHQWAEQLAREGTLRHSSLTEGITAYWLALGETLSVGSSPDEALALQLASPTHRQKLLDGRYDHAGIGVAHGAGGVYLVVALMQLSP